MSMRSTVVYIAVAVLAPVSVVVPGLQAVAQGPAAVQSITAGTRVRITAPGAITPARQAGRLLSLQPDTVMMLPDGGAASVALPLANVAGIEVSQRQHRRTGTGILVGILAGGATGLLVGAATYQDSKPSQLIDPIGRSASAGVGGLLGAVVGGAAGGLVGHAHQSDDWTKVSLSQRAVALLMAPNHLSIAPGRGGVALLFGLRFGRG